MRTAALFFALAVATVSSGSVAQSDVEVDGRFDIAKSCASAERVLRFGDLEDQNIVKAGGCLGFIHGFLSSRGLSAPVPEAERFCPPGPIEIIDIVSVFNAFIDTDPAWRATAMDTPAVTMLAAVQDAWPCQ